VSLVLTKLNICLHKLIKNPTFVIDQNKYHNKITQLSKLLLSTKPSNKFKKYFNERITTFHNHLLIIEEALTAINEHSFKITSSFKKMLKLNKKDSDFIAKWRLTFKDKDYFSLIVSLENITCSILNELSQLENVLYRYLTEDLLFLQFVGTNENPMLKKNEGLFDDITSYYIVNYAHTFELTNQYKGLSETFRNYHLFLTNESISILNKIDNLLNNVIYPSLTREILSDLKKKYSENPELMKKARLFSTDPIRPLISFSRKIVLYSEYQKEPDHKELRFYQTENFSVQFDKYLRKNCMKYFGYDFLSKNKWNLSNRIQLMELATVLQHIIRLFYQNPQNLSEEVLTQLSTAYNSLNFITWSRIPIDKPRSVRFLNNSQ